MPIALVTKVAVRVESIDPGAARRESSSSTTQQYSLLSRVGCSVMSVTHIWPSRRVDADAAAQDEFGVHAADFAHAGVHAADFAHAGVHRADQNRGSPGRGRAV
ncbi:hypothetical protein [Nonomuraea sp. CA-141351]|uniref:hypothetical protein n=1 Tax=Nonomuraea sp. CA-141351 TaxID=3239996 RepID=UPI003D8B97C5